MSNQSDEYARKLDAVRPDIFHDVRDAITPRGLAFKSEAERIAAHGEAQRGGFSVVVKTAPENSFQKPPEPLSQSFGSLEEATRAFSRMEPGERDRVSLSVGARELAHKVPQMEDANGQAVVTGERWQWTSLDGQQQRKAVTYPDPTPTRPEVIPGQDIAAKLEAKEARHLQIVAVRADRADAAEKVKEAAREVLGDLPAEKPAPEADAFGERLRAAREGQRTRTRSPDRYREI